MLDLLSLDLSMPTSERFNPRPAASLTLLLLNVPSRTTFDPSKAVLTHATASSLLLPLPIFLSRILGKYLVQIASSTLWRLTCL